MSLVKPGLTCVCSIKVVSRAMNLSTHLESSRLAKDLEDSRKTCLSVLVAYLALHSITGTNGLAVVTLTLMLYTISLHIAAIVGASRQLGVVVFAILHAIPAVGIFAVTSAQLAFTVRSPTVAISIIILCFLPAMVTILQYICTTISGDPLSATSAARSEPSDMSA
ncbi:hypothetical protein K503DRAFT_856913 [Rhizopogon vinicolor AM-OR11-026]|uniref:Uncharacterized protein n=1 Tax=Rhizopogon vinicolor AM-OR11-026 TaxID=1314800 RepID=A0A1B7MZS9_9AGAM|nr:hypothetical protein K503DRAFT_856913 [Rhizopogon vinicolor AM-OR11-026]